MATTHEGTANSLIMHPLKTWRGWVIYSWEMGFVCHLFNKKPGLNRVDGKPEGFDFENAIEGISPYFLQACGITVPFDVMGDAGQQFYYGEGCYHGSHPPIRIALTLPKPLLEQLNLL